MITQLREKPQNPFVPVATVLRDIDAFAQQFSFKINHDTDDLGPMKCAYLQTGRGNVFVLFGYALRSSPPMKVDLGIVTESNDLDGVLRDIKRELRLTKKDVVLRELA